MNKNILGVLSVTAVLFLSGCGEDSYNAFPNQPTSVAQMMGNQKIVGWTDYNKDSDGDGVDNKFDKCPKTPQGIKVDKNGCPLDNDNDGVANYLDKCPKTPFGAKVDKNGCPVDSDADGIFDYLDECPNTPLGMEVNKNGCPPDSDGDGVYDSLDKCPKTPEGASVDEKGCVLDSDKDGIPDYLDQCENTPKNAKVDKNGCAIDSDGDGVANYLDRCPNTPAGVAVNFQGCPILKTFRFNFKTNQYKIDKKYYPEIKKLADILQKDPTIKVEIEGYTDNQGKFLYNKELSIKRANSLREILIDKFKIMPERIDIVGYGTSHPIASNDTEEGRKLNRRILVVDVTNFE